MARSCRIWALSYSNLHVWAKNKDVWRAHLQGQKLLFATLVPGELSVDMLIEVMSKYTKHCVVSGKSTSLNDIRQIKTHFATKLLELYETKSTENRVYFFNRFRSFFSKAFPEEKWNELALLFEKPSITYGEVLSVVASFRFTSNEGAAMSISYMTCGEMKIALDCCQELGSLSQEEKNSLPKTLGARLQFSAFRKQTNEKGEIGEIAICERCQEMWPVYEALYWLVRESGLNLASVAEMDRLSRKTPRLFQSS